MHEHESADLEAKMLDLPVQPPTHAQPDTPLYPPVAARLRSSRNMYNELGQIWAVATLVDQHGQTVDEHPSGRTADSAHPLNQSGHASGNGSNSRHTSRDQAYFYFPGLEIHTPGRYRVRITLMRMEYNHESPEGEGVAIAEDFVDSRSIVVEDGNSTHTRPSSREREFLRLIRQDGQDVPSPPA